MDQAKLREVFSDKAYVESILKMSAEDAAKSLQDRGVEVTAEDLMKVRDVVSVHKEELQNGELSEDVLTGVAGGVSDNMFALISGMVAFSTVALLLVTW